MPTPISQSNSSVYDPASQESSCDPSNASCEARSIAGQTAAVSIPPVLVEGDAGKDLLLRRFDGAPQPHCGGEVATAVLTCAGIGGGILTTIAGAATVIGAAPGIYATLLASTACGAELRNLYECERQ